MNHKQAPSLLDRMSPAQLRGAANTFESSLQMVNREIEERSSKGNPMDPEQAKALLDQLSDDDILTAADELIFYVNHRKAQANKPAGAPRAPFNFGNFFKNVIKVVQALAPVVLPLIGADPASPSQAPSQA